MDLKQLECVLTVAKKGSISRAAKTLHIAQPALSRRLRMLEEEVGVELLIRSASGVSLTPAGALVVDHAREILNSVAAMRKEVRQLSADIPTSLSLGVAQPESNFVNEKLLDRIDRRAPSVRLRVTGGWSAQIVEMLYSRQIDFGVVCGSQASEFKYRRRLAKEPLYIFGHKQILSDAPSNMPAAQINAFDLILPPDAQGIRLLLDQTLGKLGIDLKPKYEAASWPLIKRIVEGARACAILSLRDGVEMLEMANIEARQIVKPKLDNIIYLVGNEEPKGDVASAAECICQIFIDEFSKPFTAHKAKLT